jgi:hypothetical protein
MEAHPERGRLHTHERRRVRRGEPEKIHEHEDFAVGSIERGERPLEVHAQLVILFRSRWIDPFEPTTPLKEAFPARLEEDASSDPEEPKLDGGFAPEPHDRSARAHECLLGEFLGSVSITNDAEEIGEHASLVGSEHIFELHRLSPLSTVKCENGIERHR